MIKKLQSTQNPLVKNIVQLQQKSKIRKSQGVFVVEGKREVLRALKKGYRFTHILLCETSNEYEQLLADTQSLRQTNHTTHYVVCSESIFKKITYRGAHAHILGVVEQKEITWDDVVHDEQSSILLLNGIEKPGNLGAVLRTANALGIQSVCLCESMVDVYHPNVIRNSLGAVFDVAVIVSSSKEALDYLIQHQYQIYVTHMLGTVAPYEASFTGRHCIVMGSEDQGVSRVWKDQADHLVCIPMQGVVDSLNVSVAASMMMYEVYRQRFSDHSR